MIQKCVAVRFSLRNRCDANGASGPRPVIGHHGLSKQTGQRRSKQTRSWIHNATWREWHNNADGL
jgi:hypothetical protein